MRKMEGEEFDHLVRFFDGMATTNWLSSIHEKMKQETGSWQGKKILDVGCGTGRFLLRGAGEAEQVTGIDISREMIKASQRLFSEHNLEEVARFLVADACKLPFSKAEFDLSVSTCVLFLLPEPTLAMDELVRVTKPNGSIVLLNPSQKMGEEAALHYCHNHRLEGFEQKTLLQWSKVSTSRHRYSTDQLSSFFLNKGAKDISNISVLDDLAIITVAKL